MCVCVCVCMCVYVCVCVSVRGEGGYTMQNSGNDPGLLQKEPIQIGAFFHFVVLTDKQERLSISSKKPDIYVGKLDA